MITTALLFLLYYIILSFINIFPSAEFIPEVFSIGITNFGNYIWVYDPVFPVTEAVNIIQFCFIIGTIWLIVKGVMGIYAMIRGGTNIIK